MTAEIRVVKDSGELGEILPDWSTLDYQDDALDVGAVTLSYRPDGLRYDLLRSGREFAILEDGEELPNGRFRLDEHDGNPISDTRGRIQFAGLTLLGRLEEAQVVPLDDETAREDTVTKEEAKLRKEQRKEFYEQWREEQRDANKEKGDTDKEKTEEKRSEKNKDEEEEKRPEFEPEGKLAEKLDAAPPPEPPHFKKATPGEVMLRLGRAARRRGAIDEIRFGFTRSEDSAGRKWDTEITRRFDVGQTLLEILRWMVETGRAEARMRGRTLLLFNKDWGIDRRDPRVLLAKGKNLKDGPRQGSKRDRINAAYCISDTGVHGWVVDHRRVRRDGQRIEGVFNAEGVTTWEELADLGRAYIDKHGDEKEQVTYGVIEGAGADPYKQYGIGDYVYVDESGKVEQVRVRSITLTWDETGAKTIAITVKDRVMRKKHRTERKVDRTNGRGHAPTRSPGRDPRKNPDGRAPRRTSQPIITSRAGSMRIAWDGKDDEGNDPIDDFDHVEVHLSTVEDFEPSEETLVDRLYAAGSIVRTDEDYGATRYARLVAVDEGGDKSEATVPEPGVTVLATADDIDTATLPAPEPEPPAAPTDTPVPKPVGGVGVIHVRWDPVTNPSYFEVEVHVGAVGFVPSDATMVGKTAGTAFSVRTLPDGTPLQYVDALGEPVFYDIVLRAVNETDKAAFSAPAQAQMHQITSPDISVAAAWVGTMEVDRLVGGTLDAEIVLAGRFEAVGAGGQRVGLSGADGFYSYGPSPAPGEQGPALVEFPVNGDPNIISGILQSSEFTSTQSATFRNDAAIASGGRLILDGKVQPPKAVPSVVANWHIVKPPLSGGPRYHGLTISPTGTFITTWSANDGSESWLEEYDKDGNRLQKIGLGDLDPQGGIIYRNVNGGRYVIYGHLRGKPTSNYRFEVRDLAFGFVKRTVDYSADKVPAIGEDHLRNSKILLMTSHTNGDNWVTSYTLNATDDVVESFSELWSLTTGFAGRDMGYVARGNFDFGAARIVCRPMSVSGDAAQDKFLVYNAETTGQTISNPTRYTAEEWQPADGAWTPGATWDAGEQRFWSTNNNGTFRRYENRTRGQGGDKTVATTFYDSDNTTQRAVTITTTSGSAKITGGAGTFATTDEGNTITGSGIPAGATLLSVQSSTDATMSTTATASASITATIKSILRETTCSPRVTQNIPRRARYTVTVGSIPVGKETAEDPDSARVYVGDGTNLATTALRLEGTIVHPDSAWTFDSDSPVGTQAPPTTNNFPGGAPAVLEASTTRADGTPRGVLRADGTGYWDGLRPVGEVIMFYGTTAPPGFLKMDGAEYSRATYPDLAAHLDAVGQPETVDAGLSPPAAGNFRVPDVRDRFPIGYGSGSGASVTLGSTEDLANGSARYSKIDHIHAHGAGALVTASRSHAGDNNTGGGGNLARITAIGGQNYQQSHDHPISGSTADSTNFTHPRIGLLFCIRY